MENVVSLRENIQQLCKNFGDTNFGDVMVVGGGISAAWELISGPLDRGLKAGGAPDLEVVNSPDTETSALLGAARYVQPMAAA